MSTWNLPPGVTTNDPHINPREERLPRQIIVRVAGWMIARYVASCEGVAVYSLMGHEFAVLTVAVAWVPRGDSLPNPPARYVIVRHAEGWAVARHVATCDGALVYSLTGQEFAMIADAAAWVAAQEERS